MVNRKYFHGARSFKNGIIFFSGGDIQLAIKTTLDDDGKITSEEYFSVNDAIQSLDTSTHDSTTDKKENQNLVKKMYFICSIVIPLILGFIFQSFYFPYILFFTMFYIVPPLYKLLKIALPTFNKRSDEHKISKFSSAQFMIINAYEDLNRVPTLKELKQYSKLSIHCPHRELLTWVTFEILMLFSVILGLRGNVNSINYLCALGICVLFSILDRKFGFTIGLEALFLRNPTDQELNVAIEGKRQLEILETKFNVK